ncbi:MAG: lysine--tRNA ligase [Candidatus Nanopelagicales bacterium]
MSESGAGPADDPRAATVDDSRSGTGAGSAAAESTGSDAEGELPEQLRVRREKRARLLDSGRDPYPVTVALTDTIAGVRARFADLPVDTATGTRVAVAGRVMYIRNGGKLCFATLQAGDGTALQAMLSQDKVGEQGLADWKADVDLGDHVVVDGEVITSRRGELSILAATWAFAAKALRPLPVSHKEIGEQTRVRQRYVDLVVRPAARQIARERIGTVASLRESLAFRDFLEVETPMLQTLHGGAAARPFVTHANAFDMELFLRIAPELFLKRCVVGGIDRVFEINRNFRNEGADSTHQPEFAMLEFYQAYGDYNSMADLTRELIQEAAQRVCGSLVVTHHDGSGHDLAGDWPSISMYPAVSAAVDLDITPDTPLRELRDIAAAAGIEAAPGWIAGKFVEELFEHHVAPSFTGPTFVRDFPLDMAPLVRAHRTEPGIAEKWDLYVDGFELATGYSELIDPVVQRERFVAQAKLAAKGDPEAMHVDEDFLRALEYGMPPTGGVGMGIDRLLMALTGLGIRETILFPLVKPE